ncbi:hypothetical protein M1403_00370 [Patescibacteria group bacterium]|nr:hypothetical protein [Patescibacteria group bacterium]
MIVVAVVALLATIALFSFRIVLAQSRDAKRAAIMHDLQFAQELYKIRNEEYYSTINTFCGVYTALVSGNYITYTPVDPGTQSPICSSADGGNPLIDNALYYYVATPSSGTYLLKLGKEAGGSGDFFSPQ